MEHYYFKGHGLKGVSIATAEWGDPRFSDSQVKALSKVAGADRSAILLGLDLGLRPVVAAKLGIPRAVRVFAIQRNGDPTEPRFTEGTVMGLAETWGN